MCFAILKYILFHILYFCGTLTLVYISCLFLDGAVALTSDDGRWIPVRTFAAPSEKAHSRVHGPHRP